VDSTGTVIEDSNITFNYEIKLPGEAKYTNILNIKDYISYITSGTLNIQNIKD